MFANIGKKIKGLAVFVCWVGIVFSAIAGIILLSQKNSYGYYRYASNGIGIYILIIGPIASWLSSITLYAFGELVDKTTDTNESTMEIRTLLKELSSYVKSTHTVNKSQPEVRNTKQKMTHSSQVPYTPTLTEQRANLKENTNTPQDKDISSDLGAVVNLLEIYSNDNVKQGFVNEPEGFRSMAWGSTRDDISCRHSERISWRIGESDKWYRTYTDTSESYLWYDIGLKDALRGFINNQLGFGVLFFETGRKEEVEAQLNMLYDSPTKTDKCIDYWLGRDTIIAFEKQPKASSDRFAVIFMSVEAVNTDCDIVSRYVSNKN